MKKKESHIKTLSPRAMRMAVTKLLKSSQYENVQETKAKLQGMFESEIKRKGVKKGD